MRNRMVPLLLVFLATVALVLNSQGKLVEAGRTIFGSEVAANAARVGNFALAFFVYLLVISFLDDRTTEYLTGVLVLGGLIYNAQTQGENAVIPVLFGGGSG